MVPHQNDFVLDHGLQNNQNCESFHGVVPHIHVSTIFYLLLYEPHILNVSMLMPAKDQDQILYTQLAQEEIID